MGKIIASFILISFSILYVFITQLNIVNAQLSSNLQDEMQFEQGLSLLGDAASVFGGVFLTFMGVALLISCIVLIVQVSLTVFVYYDSKRNQISNPILWALLTFFFPVITILIYLLAIRPDAKEKINKEKVSGD